MGFIVAFLFFIQSGESTFREVRENLFSRMNFWSISQKLIFAKCLKQNMYFHAYLAEITSTYQIYSSSNTLKMFPSSLLYSDSSLSPSMIGQRTLLILFQAHCYQLPPTNHSLLGDQYNEMDLQLQLCNFPIPPTSQLFKQISLPSDEDIWLYISINHLEWSGFTINYFKNNVNIFYVFAVIKDTHHLVCVPEHIFFLHKTLQVAIWISLHIERLKKIC